MQLTETLEIPLRQRNRLLTAAGFAPFYRERRLSERDMALIEDALERMLRHHDPYPAVVVDRDYDLLLQNQAFTALIAWFGEPALGWAACGLHGRPNVLRVTFHVAGARPFIRNFAEVGPLMLQRLHRELATTRAQAALALVEELGRDPNIPAHWHVNDHGATAPRGLAAGAG